MKFALYAGILLASGAFAFWMFHQWLEQHDLRVIESYGKSRQEKPRFPLADPVKAGEAVLPREEELPDEVMEKECTDILAQLEQRRKDMRKAKSPS